MSQTPAEPCTALHCTAHIQYVHMQMQSFTTTFQSKKPYNITVFLFMYHLIFTLSVLLLLSLACCADRKITTTMWTENKPCLTLIWVSVLFCSRRVTPWGRRRLVTAPLQLCTPPSRPLFLGVLIHHNRAAYISSKLSSLGLPQPTPPAFHPSLSLSLTKLEKHCFKQQQHYNPFVLANPLAGQQLPANTRDRVELQLFRLNIVKKKQKKNS